MVKRVLLFVGFVVVVMAVNAARHPQNTANLERITETGAATPEPATDETPPAREEAVVAHSDDEPVMPGANVSNYRQLEINTEREWSIYNSWGGTVKECIDNALKIVPAGTSRGNAVQWASKMCDRFKEVLPDMLLRAGIQPKPSDYMTDDKWQEMIRTEMVSIYGP